jgi:hypothetical protein
MSDDKTNQEVKTDQPKARKILGREEMFDVFKTGGEAELFARPVQKKHRVETETRTGPSIQHQITDALGPSIQHEITDALGPSIQHEITDANGPTIDHSLMDSEGPSINRTEIADADGPTITHHMSDGIGPIIKKTEIADADGPTINHQMNDANGPTINHQMSDANGPVIKQVLENTIVKLPTSPNPIASITKTDVQSSEHQPENSSASEPAHRVDTFSVHMAERIAKMKSEQKEIKTKMDDLEANTQKMQVKLTKK